jgi:hypothetical protein
MNGKTILSINQHGALTPNELERFAYIQGNSLLACYAAETDDLEGQVDGFDDLVDVAKSEAFESGKREGIGLATAEIIDGLERSLMDLKASHQRCRNNLQAVHDWLRSDGCKTAKSRQAFEKRLLAALNVTPRY